MALAVNVMARSVNVFMVRRSWGLRRHSGSGRCTGGTATTARTPCAACAFGWSGGKFRREMIADEAEHRDGFESVLRRAVGSAETFVDWVERFDAVDVTNLARSASAAAGGE